MKKYKKRIMFLISQQHLIPHGGLGSFAKSFTEMATKLDWKVDLVLDKPANSDFAKLLETLGANLISPYKQIDDSMHKLAFGFSDTINFEQIANFRQSIIEAHTKNLYDMIIANTQESMTAILALDLIDYVPIIFYTHQPSMVNREHKPRDVFATPYHEFYNKHLEFEQYYVGTQSERNKTKLEQYGATNVIVLPMPMSEQQLLTSSEHYNKEGVLYIGRWEPRKNPELFVKLIEQTNLPARVMTNQTGAKKFKQAFDKIGHKDYVIKQEIWGTEKSEFIKHSQLFFNPSYQENYPFTQYEAIGHMHTVVTNEQDWADNFSEQYYTITTKQTMAQDVITLYNQPQSPNRIDYVIELNNNIANIWQQFLESTKTKQNNSNQAKITQYKDTSIRDYMNQLNRKQISQEDIVSVIANKHKFNVIITDTDTYLTTTLNYEPQTNQLFEGL